MDPPPSVYAADTDWDIVCSSISWWWKMGKLQQCAVIQAYTKLPLERKMEYQANISALMEYQLIWYYNLTHQQNKIVRMQNRIRQRGERCSCWWVSAVQCLKHNLSAMLFWFIWGCWVYFWLWYMGTYILISCACCAKVVIYYLCMRLMNPQFFKKWCFRTGVPIRRTCIVRFTACHAATLKATSETQWKFADVIWIIQSVRIH